MDTGGYMNQTDAPTQPQRSSFVTVVAWIFIILTGFATCISLLQNVMITLFFHVDDMRQTLEASAHDPHAPPFANFMFSHIRMLMGIMLLVTSTLFVVSIGLLKRRNWARLLFICFLALGIVWNIGGLYFQMEFVSSMNSIALPPNAPPDFAIGFRFMSQAILVFSLVLQIALSVVFAWIIKKLVSPEIRTEFQKPFQPAD